MSRCERCQADKSAVSDGVEEPRSCISVMGCMPRESDHVSFGKPSPVRAALLSPQTGNGAGLCGVWTRVVTPASPVLPLEGSSWAYGGTNTCICMCCTGGGITATAPTPAPALPSDGAVSPSRTSNSRLCWDCNTPSSHPHQHPHQPPHPPQPAASERLQRLPQYHARIDITARAKDGTRKLLIWRGGDASAAEQPCSQWRFRGNREHNMDDSADSVPSLFARTVIYPPQQLVGRV